MASLLDILSSQFSVTQNFREGEVLLENGESCSEHGARNYFQWSGENLQITKRWLLVCWRSLGGARTLSRPKSFRKVSENSGSISIFSIPNSALDLSGKRLSVDSAVWFDFSWTVSLSIASQQDLQQDSQQDSRFPFMQANHTQFHIIKEPGKISDIRIQGKWTTLKHHKRISKLHPPHLLQFISHYRHSEENWYLSHWTALWGDASQPENLRRSAGKTWSTICPVANGKRMESIQLTLTDKSEALSIRRIQRTKRLPLSNSHSCGSRIELSVWTNCVLIRKFCSILIWLASQMTGLFPYRLA